MDATLPTHTDRVLFICDKRLLRTRCSCVELSSQEAPSKGEASGRRKFTSIQSAAPHACSTQREKGHVMLFNSQNQCDV
ncbi:MAG TPA: hypothetical protein DCE42_14750 [Myxococcales bacterium]|nr:hypothetical protein [Deltaproteobacteria bacterium]MBU54536.1 hypothetical protein [Deltaproteobacteria bacterium]HAA56021.1 hypothetical protein [Myxococcales bacterium]